MQEPTHSGERGGYPSLSDTLLCDAILSRAPASDLAHMLMHVGERRIEKGEALFKEGEPADTVFLVRDGAFSLSGEEVGEVCLWRRDPLASGGYLGQEAVLGARGYKVTAVALEPSSVIEIPTQDIRQLADAHPEIKNLFFASYARRESCVASEPPPPGSVSGATEDAAPFPVREMVGWCATLLVALGCWLGASRLGLEKNTVFYLAIIASAVVLWVFQLVPAFAPPLFVVIMVILLDIVPPDVAVSGFASGSFFMLLSVFGVGAVMVVSGLTFRLSLMVLSLVPSSSFWYSICLFSSGLFLTPVVPSQGARMAILSPFLVDLMGASDPQEKDVLGAHFVNSTLGGIGLMASVFLTGKPANLIVLGLFDYQTQFAFQWMNWLVAASFTGLLMLILFFGTSWVVFRDSRQFRIPRTIVSEQLKVLGPLSSMEWTAAISVGVLILGILFSSVHKVDIPWVALSILTVLILFGGVGKREIRSHIDWSTLLFVGAIIAWLPVMSLTGLDTLVAKHLDWLGEYMRTSLPMFIGLLCLIIVLVRLFLPEPITVILFVTALFPLADVSGVSPWIVGFIILTMAEAYLFSYQCGYFIQLKDILGLKGFDGLYDEGRIFLFNILMIMGRVLAIYASLPFWRYLDII
ncbi:SLC13 family permease [Desulfoluna spongiiphila]|uniref:SLC13 family permease n=1 Tax=Desulfoluna spongiiphila TaxID=419481 RepID=UPI00125C13BB|nr:SLC13 family permease [Desulfoluna spongiiphila]VVS95106.1 solute carrier family 13 [Desulfoluna spongiiphila]